MKEFSTCLLCSGCTLRSEIDEPPSYLAICDFLGRTVPLIVGDKTGWRMKAKLAIRGTASAPLIGLFREGTHDVVDTVDCRANHPSINEAIQLLRESIVRLQVAPYNESDQSGVLRYAQFFVCRETGLVQIVLVSREEDAVESLAKDLWNPAKMHSIWINVQPHPTNQILGNVWQHCFGAKWMWQKLGRCQAAFHPGAFAQANLALFDRVLEKTEEWLPGHPRLLEIYAGVGAISFHLSPHCRSVHLIEDNPYAHLSFQQTVLLSHPKSMRYIQADAGQGAAYIDQADCVIVDPPRKGMDPALLETLRGSSSKTLIYISCSFKSFQRDAAQLLSSGWLIEDAALYWLFPGTDHVEIATKWKKHDGY
jgi:23S rRNA (uracil1939-C5)-methyltransferase